MVRVRFVLGLCGEIEHQRMQNRGLCVPTFNQLVRKGRESHGL